jgi:hypothetical protein
MQRVNNMGGERRLSDVNNPNPHNITNPLWEYEGIKGDAAQPEPVGKHTGACIIVAGARGVYEEYESAKEFLGKCNKPFTLLAVNDIGCFIKGNVYAIITAHPEWASGWIAWRTGVGHSGYGPECMNRPLIYADTQHPCVDVVWSGLGNQVGTSGMLACLIAICMGFDKIILAGMPLDFSIPHFFSPYLIHQSDESNVINKSSWEYATTKLPTFPQKIRSMSGITKQMLGEPSDEWMIK